ncbi:FAD-binding oxidoreductase [soil metagenome]
MAEPGERNDTRMKTADIVIVGGGVMGVSIAHSLAARQAGRVVLLEKRYLGAGSSGKSGAICRQHYSNALTALMARKSLEVYREFSDRVGGPAVFTHTGMMLVVKGQDRRSLETNVALQQSLGIDVKLISTSDVRELDPEAKLDGGEIAAFESEAGYVEAVQVVASYAVAAEQLGAEIECDAPLTALHSEGGRIRGVTAGGERWECGTVIVAAGPWASWLLTPLGLRLPIQACRTQVGLFRRPTTVKKGGPVYGDFSQGIYFKPTHGDMMHAGSIGGEEINDPVDPDNYTEVADATWLPGIRQRLARRIPAMSRGYGRGGYGALYAITPDWHPVIDRCPGVEGLYVAAGFSGHGFKMAPVVGSLVSELVLDGVCRTLDIKALRFNRFDEKDLVTTPYGYGVMG